MFSSSPVKEKFNKLSSAQYIDSKEGDEGGEGQIESPKKGSYQNITTKPNKYANNAIRYYNNNY